MIKFKYWNILAQIKGSKPYPYSRWLSTSLEQKLSDTIYTVFIALNWLTLGIFIANYKLLALCVDILFKMQREDTNLLVRSIASLFIFPLMIIHDVGELAISALTIAITLPLIPIVFFIHLLSNIIKHIHINSKEVKTMQVNEIYPDGTSSQTTIGQFLKENKVRNIIKDVELDIWPSLSEINLIFRNNKKTIAIGLTKQNEEGINRIAKADIIFLQTLNSIGHYNRMKK